MREFKFRIWDKARRRMSQWEEMKENWNLHVFVTSDEDLEIMQYTGLKDRNGQEIYEGDILKVVFKHSELGGESKAAVDFGGVLFDEEYATYRVFGEDEIPEELCYWHQENPYVVGNIYENPELLEAQNV